MSDQVTFKRCYPDMKLAINDIWAQKTPRLTRLLQNYRPDLRRLRLSVERKGDTFNVRCVLSLPTGTLAAIASGKSFQTALDQAADHMAMEIRRHKDHVRREDMYSRSRNRQKDAAIEALSQAS